MKGLAPVFGVEPGKAQDKEFLTTLQIVTKKRAYEDHLHKPLNMVRPTGIEPVAYNLGGCRSIQLSYERNPDFVVILQGHVKLSVF